MAANSSYFRAMFTHDLIEQKQTEIDIKDLDFLSVSSIIDYLYTGKIKITDQNVQDLLMACSILQVSNVSRQWGNFLILMGFVNNAHRKSFCFCTVTPYSYSSTIILEPIL